MKSEYLVMPAVVQQPVKLYDESERSQRRRQLPVLLERKIIVGLIHRSLYEARRQRRRLAGSLELGTPRQPLMCLTEFRELQHFE